jgi:hypothetical protein
MPIVGVFIDDTIGLNGVPSYENKQCISNEDYSADEQLYQILSIMDYFPIQYKHRFCDDKLLLFVHNLFYYQGEKY